LSFDKETREKSLNLNFYDDNITSDDENNFEAKELIEEGEVVDPMKLERFDDEEEGEEEEDAAELKQDDQ
jgi:hypothetical protein